MIDYRRLRVALLGAGAVGSQVAALLLKHGDELADRAGAALELVGIAVRDLDTALGQHGRPVAVRPQLRPTCAAQGQNHGVGACRDCAVRRPERLAFLSTAQAASFKLNTPIRRIPPGLDGSEWAEEARQRLYRRAGDAGVDAPVCQRSCAARDPDRVRRVSEH